MIKHISVNTCNTIKEFHYDLFLMKMVVFVIVVIAVKIIKLWMNQTNSPPKPQLFAQKD